MMRTVRAAAAIAIAIAASIATGTPASAQDASLPPVRTVDVQDLPPRAPEVPRQMLDAFDSHCRDDRPSTQIPAAEDTHATFTAMDGEADVLAICIRPLSGAMLTPVDTIEQALTLLSLKDLEGLWPNMEAQWGSDLSILRADLTDWASDANSTMYGRMLSGSPRRDIARAQALRDAGEWEDAMLVLENSHDELNERRRRNARRLDFDRGLVASYIASTLYFTDGHLAAAAYLGEYIETLDAADEHRLNPLINQAAYLAEGGEYVASMRIIMPAYEDFRGVPIASSTYRVGGADREFAWIIACNHWHLDKPEIAQPFIDIVEEAEERPRDEYQIRVKRSTVIERRMYRCMDDGDGFYRQFGDGSLHPLDNAWLVLQPAATIEAPLKGWTMPDHVAEYFSERYRVLPERFTPALRRWLDD